MTNAISTETEERYDAVLNPNKNVIIYRHTYSMATAATDVSPFRLSICVFNIP